MGNRSGAFLFLLGIQLSGWPSLFLYLARVYLFLYLARV